MKYRHQFSLAMIAVLGMITFGAGNVGAQSNNPKSNNVQQVRQTKNEKSNSLDSRLKSDSSNNDDKAQARSISKSHSAQSQNSRTDLKNGSKNDKGVKDLEELSDLYFAHGGKKGRGHSKHGSLIDRLLSKLNLDKKISKDKIKGNRNVHVDDNKREIDGMNKFSRERRHYLYHLIGGNTRDLGGYQTERHRYTKPGRIIRSADLDGISDSGIKALKKLHVNKIVDLRYYQGKDGIEGHPDPSELKGKVLNKTGIHYQLAPLYTKEESHQLHQYMKNHDERGEYYYYGDLSVSKPRAIKTYRAIFNDLLNNKSGAIMFHCNLGRDRTGVTSALILSALGVNRNVIYHDYLLTDHYHYNINKIQPYSKQAAELQYFFSTIDHKYGSVHTYLSKKIGLNHAKIVKLRKMYLINNK